MLYLGTSEWALLVGLKASVEHGHMFRICTLVVAVMLLSAGTVTGQSAQTQGHNRDPGPVTMLLQLQSRLGLSADQVSALREIEAEMNRLNRPLATRLSQIRKSIKSLGPVDSLSVDQRAAFDGYVAELRPVVDQIQENNWAAMRRVGDVLTERQREHLARILRDLNDHERERSSNFPRPSSRGN